MNMKITRAAFNAAMLSATLVCATFTSPSTAADQPKAGTTKTTSTCPPFGWSEGLVAYLKPDAQIPTQQPKSDCDFHEWSWEAFVWATALDTGGVPRFMTLPTPDDLTGTSVKGKKGAKHVLRLATRTHGIGSTGKAEGAGAIVEADGNMLVAPSGYPVYASVHMNSSYFATAKNNLIVTGGYSKNLNDYFAVGSAVFKATWVRIDPKYPLPAGTYTTQAEVPVLTNINNVVAPAIVNGKVKTVSTTVALVGLHVVGQTIGHPEFLWGTFEHNLNAPAVPDNTFSPTGSNPQNYTFYQAGTSYANANATPLLSFNEQTQKFLPITNVVLENKTGGESNPGGVENIGNLNTSAQNFLKNNPKQKLFANYNLIGTVWMNANTYVESNPNWSNLAQANAVGSVSLANSTAETFVQIATIFTTPPTTPPTQIPASNFQNCFMCHNPQSFGGFKGATLPARRIGISHIVANNSTYAVPNQISLCADMNAGPIWNNDDAKAKCPTVCSNNKTTWNGQWKTTKPGTESVCGCCNK